MIGFRTEPTHDTYLHIHEYCLEDDQSDAIAIN